MFTSQNILLPNDKFPYPELTDLKFLQRIILLPDPPFTPKEHKIQIPNRESIIHTYSQKLLHELPVCPPIRKKFPSSSGPKNLFLFTTEEFHYYTQCNIEAIADNLPLPYPLLQDPSLKHRLRVLPQPQNDSSPSQPPTSKLSKPPSSTTTKKLPVIPKQTSIPSPIVSPTPSTSKRKRKPKIPPPKAHKKATYEKTTLDYQVYQARIAINTENISKGLPPYFPELLDPEYIQSLEITYVHTCGTTAYTHEPPQAVPKDPFFKPPPKRPRTSKTTHKQKAKPKP